MLSKACACCFCCFGERGKRSNRIGGLERKIYLLMLGLDNAGKTSAAKSFVGDVGSLKAVAPTIGFSKVETKYKGFQVTIYDLGGSKGFRSFWPNYYHEVSSTAASSTELLLQRFSCPRYTGSSSLWTQTTQPGCKRLERLSANC